WTSSSTLPLPTPLNHASYNRGADRCSQIANTAIANIPYQHSPELRIDIRISLPTRSPGKNDAAEFCSLVVRHAPEPFHPGRAVDHPGRSDYPHSRDRRCALIGRDDRVAPLRTARAEHSSGPDGRAF